MMKPPAKYVALTDQLYDYIARHRSRVDDPVLRELRAETESLGDVARMLISPEQGDFLTLLTKLLNVQSAIEVGTFTGYSSLCIARALPPSGRLICIDQSQEWTSVARKYWAQAGLQNRIDLCLGDAIPILKQLEPGLTFDFAFIDAEKTQYDAYYELILPRVRPNGLILFDNMLWGGRLGAGPIKEPSGLAIDALNHKLAKDPRIETVLLPIADGLQLCRKRNDFVQFQ